MTKVEQFKRELGDAEISVHDGQVWATQLGQASESVGVINRVVVCTNESENTPGVSFIDSIMIYDEAGEELYDDMEKRYTPDFFSIDALIDSIVTAYGIERGTIQIGNEDYDD